MDLKSKQPKRSLVLAHGLEGSPHGRKASALKNCGYTLHCPDCRGLNLAQRIEKLDLIVSELQQFVLVGSSYGGLVALWLAQRYPSKTLGLVLCAPAFQRSEAPLFENRELPNSIPGHIIHGTRDRIVPATVSQDFVAKHPHVRLELVDDDHSLAHSTPSLLRAVRPFLDR